MGREHGDKEGRRGRGDSREEEGIARGTGREEEGGSGSRVEGMGQSC